MRIYPKTLRKSSLRRRFRVCEGSSLFVQEEGGFALPSVLFLLTILSVLAFSLLSVTYLQNKIALKEIHQIQAEFAAQSGIADLLDRLSEDFVQPPYSQAFKYPDGSTSLTKATAWGGLLAIESVGRSHSEKVMRQALVAQLPSKDLDAALLLANPDHSLVLTGSARIRGEVIVGKAGVSVGTLRDYSTPMRVPIVGKITKKDRPQLPPYDSDILEGECALFDLLIERLGNPEVRPERQIHLTGNQLLDLSEIADLTELITVEGNLELTGLISRRGSPLYLVSAGSVLIKPDTRLEGLIAVCANDELRTAQESRSDNVILYSRRGIILKSNDTLCGQFISPSVHVESGTYLQYPSLIFSIEPKNAKESQNVVLKSGSVVEGTVALLSTLSKENNDDIVTLENDAVVTGAIYSEGRVSLDGMVHGCVLTRDFYFYEAPTHYMGWIRKGIIDRPSLPKGFMSNPGLSGEEELGILSWL